MKSALVGAPSVRLFSAVLLADGLQGVQGAFDVADLRCQAVYGLHGAIQLLAAGHQRVHALQEPGNVGGKKKLPSNHKWIEREKHNRNIKQPEPPPL